MKHGTLGKMLTSVKHSVKNNAFFSFHSPERIHIMSKVKKKTGKSCKFSVTLEDIHRYLPITKWLPSYGLRKLQGDVIAGLTVGVMLVPHSLAQGTFAGLPPIYGLYTAFPGLFIYCLLGTCKDMNIGPTLVTALLANQYSLVDKKRPEIPAMLTFFSGLILLAIGLFKLGFVVRFISTPVISGFVSSAAIIIVVNQLHDLFGLRKHAKTFIGKLTDFFENIVRTKPGDAALGLTCLVLLITLGFVSKRKQNTKKSSTPSTCRTIGRSALFYAAIGKSPLIALLSTVVSYIFFITGYRNVFTLAGDMPSGLPSFQVRFLCLCYSPYLVFICHCILKRSFPPLLTKSNTADNRIYETLDKKHQTLSFA